MQTLLHTFPNVGTPAFTQSITNIDWFTQIICPEPKNLKIIEEAREVKLKYLRTHDKKVDDEYKAIKKTLPAVTWNACRFR